MWDDEIRVRRNSACCGGRRAIRVFPSSGREIRNKRSAETATKPTAGPSEIYSPRPGEVNRETEREREREWEREREREREPVVNGRWSRGALSYAKHSGHRDPTVFRFDTYSVEGRETGWRTSLYCVSFQLPRPGPGDRFLVWFLVAYFLRYPVKWDRFCAEFT